MTDFKLSGLHKLNLYKVTQPPAGEIKKTKQAETAPSFTDELDAYISQQAEKIEKKAEGIAENISKTDKLDAYIAKQAQNLYSAQKPIKEKTASEITKIEKNPSVEEPVDIRESLAEKMHTVQSVNFELRPERANIFADLHIGSSGDNVKELQLALNRWMPKLRIRANGYYDYKTAKAVTLFKAIYGTGKDGRRIDPATSKLIMGLSDGSFWKYEPDKSQQYRPQKTVGGEVLSKAADYLGTPYVLGGDGNNSTDCAMLTKTALVKAGIADENYTRLADSQYQIAEQKGGNLSLVNEPKPGDIIFFKNTSRQANIAYKGITHVGIYVGENLMLAASPSYGGVTLQNISDINPSLIAGYGRPAPQSKVKV